MTDIIFTIVVAIILIGCIITTVLADMAYEYMKVHDKQEYFEESAVFTFALGSWLSAWYIYIYTNTIIKKLNGHGENGERNYERLQWRRG